MANKRKRFIVGEGFGSMEPWAVYFKSGDYYTLITKQYTRREARNICREFNDAMTRAVSMREKAKSKKK